MFAGGLAGVICCLVALLVLPRIFEKGYTGYNGRADKKSTGIGLYLCKRITDQLGHYISVHSAPGEGTEVLICLERYDLKTE